MTELFRMEAESQTQLLTTSLLALEREPTAADHLEACMRAAHSLKGAARLVGVNAAIGIAHVMEDCFVAAQRGEIVLGARQIDLLLKGVDLLGRTADSPAGASAAVQRAEADRFVAALAALLAQAGEDAVGELPDAEGIPESAPLESAPGLPAAEPAERERVLRVTADNFNRLLGLASESLVESRRLSPFLGSLLRLKRQHQDVFTALDGLRGMVAQQGDPTQTAFAELRAGLEECRHVLTERMTELDLFERRTSDLARRLYDEALACRMRPFADGLAGLPKLVRGLARSLGKQVRLDLLGAATQVDRDILQKLDSPLNHLLRNAIDHGIELPHIRLSRGKPAEGVIRLQASHSAGTLHILIADDGCGIDLDRLRQAIVTRGVTQQAVAETLSTAELLEFLFLPGFTMKGTVTEISGRGVGLDAVQTTVKQVRGTIRVTTQAGGGTSFELRLPLTLSVMRTLLADIGGEAYAFPLAHIVRTLKLPRGEIELVEGKPHFRFEGRLAGLVGACQVLGGPTPPPDQDAVSVVVVDDAGAAYGLIVDRFLGERDTVVQPLDARLGKIADILAGGVMEDGSPVLIVDVADMLRSVEKLISGGTLNRMSQAAAGPAQRKRKRVLVVDDSLTVRELQRKLLEHAGYFVETAVDGVDGWNVARAGQFDLVITDIDMPRMDGIELVRLIRKDAHLNALRVMIVSYKDSEEDRRMGSEAGADYYLAKGGFHDETLLQAVGDLIGEPVA